MWVYLSLAVPPSTQARGGMYNSLCVTAHKESLCSLWARWPVIPSPCFWSSQHKQENQITHLVWPQQARPFCFSFSDYETPFSPGDWHQGSAPCVCCVSPIVRPISCLLCSVLCTSRLSAVNCPWFPCRWASCWAWSAMGVASRKEKGRRKGIRVFPPCFTGVWQDLWPFSTPASAEGIPPAQHQPLGSGDCFLLLSLCPGAPVASHCFWYLGAPTSVYTPYPFHTTVNCALIHALHFPVWLNSGPC